MTRDKFAVLSKRGRNKRALVSEPSLEDLVESIAAIDEVRADRFLAVEYQSSGYMEIAGADRPEQLLSMVRQKVGVR